MAEALAHAILARAMKGARATVTVEDATAFTVDPVFVGLQRNRPNAEILKAAHAVPAPLAESWGFGPDIRRKLAARLLRAQKPDGCWHEIHPNYDEPSALATSFMGEALLARLDSKEPDEREEDAITQALHQAATFVLTKERRPGFFLKSEKYVADHLNVDASCAAFLASYASRFTERKARDAALRAIQHVAGEQFPSGAYPYTTADDGPPYPHPIHVPCIHYQGVTGYYLAKAHRLYPTPEGANSLHTAAKWLANVQRPDGRFDWSKSHMMFASHLSGAYAFAAVLFAHEAQSDPKYADHMARALHALDAQVPALAWRWEAGRKRDLPADVTVAIRSGWHGAFPPGQKLLRVGHGLYRQMGRRGTSDRAEVRLFHALRRTLRLTASTVEPSKNFPDLFMTSEIVDCLAHVRGSAAITSPREAVSP